MKIYISGPITGHKNYLSRFARVESLLKKQGQEVINPAEIMFPMPPSTTHQGYMLVSLALLRQCDAIYMLEGWQQSKGATMEFEYAVRHGITIAFEGGTVWEENRSGQEPQSLRQKLEQKSFKEIMGNAFSAQWATTSTEQQCLIEK